MPRKRDAFVPGFRSRPLGLVGSLPSAVPIGRAEVIQRLGNAKQSRAIGWRGGNGLGGQTEKPNPAAGGRGGGAVGDPDQAAQVGLQQVGIVSEQLVDQTSGVRVSGQEAQQVARDVVPVGRPAVRDERLGERVLVSPARDMSARSCSRVSLRA